MCSANGRSLTFIFGIRSVLVSGHVAINAVGLRRHEMCIAYVLMCIAMCCEVGLPRAVVWLAAEPI